MAFFNHRHGLLTLGKILDLYVETLAMGLPGIYHGKVDPTFAFHVHMS
jgi:hypothetical protein